MIQTSPSSLTLILREFLLDIRFVWRDGISKVYKIVSVWSVVSPLRMKLMGKNGIKSKLKNNHENFFFITCVLLPMRNRVLIFTYYFLR